MVGYAREQPVSPGYGITHRKLEMPQEDVVKVFKLGLAFGRALEEDAALANVAWMPGREPPSRGDEGVGEVSGVGDGACERRGGARRLGGVKAIVGGEAEERGRVDGAEPAEEAAVRDDAAEGSARSGGACDVSALGRRRKISSRSSSVRLGSVSGDRGSAIGGAGEAMAAANKLPAPGGMGLWRDPTEGSVGLGFSGYRASATAGTRRRRGSQRGVTLLHRVWETGSI